LTHIGLFNAICNVDESKWIHPLYPVTYVYPLVKGDFSKSNEGRFDIYCGENPKPCICCRIGRDS